MLSKNHYNITPNGDIVPCLEEIGDPSAVKPITSIFDDRHEEKRNEFINNSKWIVDIEPGCAECNVLPICTGGCPKDRMGRSKFSMPSKCTQYKQILNELIYILGNAWMSDNIKNNDNDYIPNAC